jgi:calcineurin-like phosphoesterase family protein
MANLFFTSDTHFGLQRTLELSQRPFPNVTEMDKALISNWSKVVGKNDTVYHLGDFGDLDKLQQLKGQIIFLPGNYDSAEVIDTIANYGKIIEPNTVITVDGHRFQLIHEPEEAIPSDRFFLFGHIHKLQMVKRNGLNVGVDCHNFAPISLETVLFYKNAIQNLYDENVFIDSIASK